MQNSFSRPVPNRKGRCRGTPISHARKGAIIVLAAIFMVPIFGFVAFSVDSGYMALVKSQLQNAADAAALAATSELGEGIAVAKQAAIDIAQTNNAAGQPVVLADADIEFGQWDVVNKTFSTPVPNPNAVRITARVTNQPLFFAPVIGHDTFDMSASAIALVNPRDIMFVIDLSGSMNDDTEPAWATDAINNRFAPEGYPTIGTDLVQDLYNDFGYGTFPGTLEHIGQTLGVVQDNYAYAELTKDDGPLADAAIPAAYRILVTDDEYVRKDKCYNWLMDNRIPILMPNAVPIPDSTDPVSQLYWSRYLDYIVKGAWVGTAPPPDPPDPPPDPPDPPPDPGPQPPGGNLEQPRNHFYVEKRPDVLGTFAGTSDQSILRMLFSAEFGFQTEPGQPRMGVSEYKWVPSGQYWWRLSDFNNPNEYTFPWPETDSGLMNNTYRNKIGYLTYVQFMLDWGRDRSPDAPSDNDNAADAVGTKTPLSTLSPHCPLHTESVGTSSYSFPPRTQPMHALRRSLIASINLIQQRNAGIASGQGDNVGIVTFDDLDTYHQSEVVVSLTNDFELAKSTSALLQAVSDVGNSTATESGILKARDHLKPVAEGGAGRQYAKKVIILLTDGVPNNWETPDSDILAYTGNNPNPDYYDDAYLWYNSVLMQTLKFYLEDNGSLYPIGIGLGTDYDFMDRVARVAVTDEGGLSVRGSGNPAIYEQRLIDIIEQIVKRPGSHLVE